MATRAEPRKKAAPATPARAQKINLDKDIEEEDVDNDEYDDNEDSDDEEEDGYGPAKIGRKKKQDFSFFDLSIDGKHYRVHSDKHSFTVSGRKRGKEGGYYYTPEAYGNSLYEALIIIRRRAINMSKYKKLSELIANTLRIDNEIKRYLGSEIPNMNEDQLKTIAKGLIDGIKAK